MVGKMFDRTPIDVFERELNPLVGGTVGTRAIGGQIPFLMPLKDMGQFPIPDIQRKGRGAFGNTETYNTEMPQWLR